MFLGIRLTQCIAVVNLFSLLNIIILYEFSTIVNLFYNWSTFKMLKFIFYYKQSCLVNYLLLYWCRIFRALLDTGELSSRVFATTFSWWAADESSHCPTLLRTQSAVKQSVTETAMCNSVVANELEHLSVYSKVIHIPLLWNVWAFCSILIGFFFFLSCWLIGGVIILYWLYMLWEFSQFLACILWSLWYLWWSEVILI